MQHPADGTHGDTAANGNPAGNGDDGRGSTDDFSALDPAKNWTNVHTVADLLAYMRAYDADHHCRHGLLWTRCWRCGHFEDYLGDADDMNEADAFRDSAD